MPPSLLLRRSTHHLLASKFRGSEKAVSLLVALETTPLLNVALALLRGQSSSDDANKIKSASVCRSSATAPTSTSATTTSSKP
jgi:hypothetical protein